MKAKPAVRSLVAPFRMNEGMDEGQAPKKKPEPVDGPLLTERDKLKIERRKRKDERQREVLEFNYSKFHSLFFFFMHIFIPKVIMNRQSIKCIWKRWKPCGLGCLLRA